MKQIQSFWKKHFEKPLLEVYPPWWILGMILIVMMDLFSKKWMTDHLVFHLTYHQLENVKNSSFHALLNGIPYIPILGEDGKYIKFRLVFNDRFIFGLGPSVPTLGIFLTFSAIVFLFFYRWKHYQFGNGFSWMLIFSGALGNFIDKLFIKSVDTREWVFSIFPKKGYVSGVVDFVECIWFGWESFSDIPVLSFLAWDTWPTFNLADSVIVVGISLLLIEGFVIEFLKEKKINY
ncbi:MAG: signal peptidase II [Leptospiraceae bacterium]|nr:signal peptidase II [Leptospiraceae bacterium]MDW7975323.1 signal peptidase II [Leptospiraceae bacterium]